MASLQVPACISRGIFSAYTLAWRQSRQPLAQLSLFSCQSTVGGCHGAGFLSPHSHLRSKEEEDRGGRRNGGLDFKCYTSEDLSDKGTTTYSTSSLVWHSLSRPHTPIDDPAHPHSIPVPTTHQHCPLTSHAYSWRLQLSRGFHSGAVFVQRSPSRLSPALWDVHIPQPLLPRGVTQSALLHCSPWRRVPDKKTKATVEKAVDTIKEKKKKSPEGMEKSVIKPPPSLARRAWDVVLHYYHGFRLLALDVRVAFRLLRKTLRGKSLTRREQKQFRRTVGDFFRVVPFSVFIVIPFMEFLLPVYLWLFPSALPSTFQSKASRDARKKQQLTVKIQMATFLQETVKEMGLASKNPNKKEAVLEFVVFFEKIRTTGVQASTEELVRFSKLFEDELTLDNLSRPQLVALCKLLLLQTIGSSNFLRFQLRMKLRQLKADDKLIQKETVDSLTEAELQGACQARGMRALGIPLDRLKSQLQQWLDLHLVQEVPASLLLLSRALYLPETVQATDALQATLSTLPENIVEEAEVRVADTVGESVDNKTRLGVTRQQEELIREEAEEKEREKEEEAARAASEELVDKAPVITTTAVPPPPTTPVMDVRPAQTPEEEGSISAEELRDLSQAVTSLKAERALEKGLEELKEDREEYREDVADLAVECTDEELQESKASARLGRRVEAMISKVDMTLQTLQSDFVSSGDSALRRMQEERDDVITTKQLEAALEALKGTSGDAKVKSLVAVLDEDHDGNISLNELAEVIETLALEDTGIKPEHIAQIKELIQKEITLEGGSFTDKKTATSEYM